MTAMSNTVAKMTDKERESAVYVKAFMYAQGIEELRVDDENRVPSYASDYLDWSSDQYEDLHHAVAWLPQGLGIISNSTPGPGNGWNPVVRREDLDRALRDEA